MGSSDTSGEASDESPHYYKFLERTKKLNLTDGDSVSLDNSSLSRNSSPYQSVEKLDEVVDEIV